VFYLCSCFCKGWHELRHRGVGCLICIGSFLTPLLSEDTSISSTSPSPVGRDITGGGRFAGFASPLACLLGVVVVRPRATGQSARAAASRGTRGRFAVFPSAFTPYIDRFALVVANTPRRLTPYPIRVLQSQVQFFYSKFSSVMVGMQEFLLSIFSRWQ
jgi:hypothetical protein